MNKARIILPEDVLPRLRALLPKQPMNYGQALHVAQMQANRLGKLLGQRPTRLPLDWVERIPGVTVTMLTASEMEQLTKRPDVSGATDPEPSGEYHIYINKNMSVTHCRFTLAHELYHVITGQFETAIFSDFGHGDPELHNRRKERIADSFAAHLLMPSHLVKKAWELPIRELPQLAAEFGVSEDAMRIRLTNIGLLDNGMTKEMLYRRSRHISQNECSRTRAAVAPTSTHLAGGLSVCLRSGAAATPHERGWFRPISSMSRTLRLFRTIARPAEPEQTQADQDGRPKRLLTVVEACEALRISRWMLYRLIHERRLRTIQIGSRRLVPAAAIDDLVARLAEEAA